MKWKLDILPENTRFAIGYLEGKEWLAKQNWYLAGGTALVLQVGHRQSVDLDFFTETKTFLPAEVIKNFPDEDKVWDAQIVQEGTIYGTVCGAKVSFIAYPFFTPLMPFIKYGSINVLDKNDIAVMKVIAISQRGRKRDFVDLYWCLNNIVSLVDVLKKLSNQYPNISHNYHHIIKSLTFFEDAEDEPMPQQFSGATWQDIKKYFQSEAPRVAKQIMGLE